MYLTAKKYIAVQSLMFSPTAMQTPAPVEVATSAQGGSGGSGVPAWVESAAALAAAGAEAGISLRDEDEMEVRFFCHFCFSQSSIDIVWTPSYA